MVAGCGGGRGAWGGRVGGEEVDGGGGGMEGCVGEWEWRGRLGGEQGAWDGLRGGVGGWREVGRWGWWVGVPGVGLISPRPVRTVGPPSFLSLRAPFAVPAARGAGYGKGREALFERPLFVVAPPFLARGVGVFRRGRAGGDEWGVAEAKGILVKLGGMGVGVGAWFVHESSVVYWLSLVASRGWSFASAVPGQMTHLVAISTLDSANSCVMQVVVIAIVGVVIVVVFGIVVVVGGVSSIFKLSFVIVDSFSCYWSSACPGVLVSIVSICHVSSLIQQKVLEFKTLRDRYENNGMSNPIGGLDIKNRVLKFITMERGRWVPSRTEEDGDINHRFDYVDGLGNALVEEEDGEQIIYVGGN
ncbi:hypothetical protein Tco_1144042 [Tanacetum coccineum]